MKYCIATIILLSLAALPAATAADSSPAAKSTTAAETLPARTDLRPLMNRWKLSPRSQGSRNTCSVFATTAAFEFAYSKYLNHSAPLSEEYLNWACNQVIHNRTRDRGQFFHDLLKGFDRYGICTNKEMPYVDRFDPDLKPSEEAIATARKIRAVDFRVHWIRRFQKESGLTDSEMQAIKHVLTNGYPVAAGADHSRLLVGYVDDKGQPGGGVFLVRDSNGGKYRKITYTFVKSNINDVFWVEAPPK